MSACPAGSSRDVPRAFLQAVSRVVLLKEGRYAVAGGPGGPALGLRITGLRAPGRPRSTRVATGDRAGLRMARDADQLAVVSAAVTAVIDPSARLPSLPFAPAVAGSWSVSSPLLGVDFVPHRG